MVYVPWMARKCSVIRAPLLRPSGAPPFGGTMSLGEVRVLGRGAAFTFKLAAEAAPANSPPPRTANVAGLLGCPLGLEEESSRVYYSKIGPVSLDVQVIAL